LQDQLNPTINNLVKAAGSYESLSEYPLWIDQLENNIDGSPVDMFFQTSDYRKTNGFKGQDYIHSSPLIGVLKLSDYRLFEIRKEQTNWFKVESAVQFTANSEGAKGWVHRGALCSLMDDAANWAGFNVSGNLNIFSGFTSKVHVNIKRPVRVNSCLKLIGKIERVRYRTNVIIKCCLVDPAYSNTIHCEADCVFVMNETAAYNLEHMVASRQRDGEDRKGSNNDGIPEPPAPWSKEWTVNDSETISDPAFRPPNRVGRYGLGMKIGEDVASQIDEATARNYIPQSGSLMANAEKAVRKKKEQQERVARMAQEEAERERIKNHPGRKSNTPSLPWQS